MIVSSWTDAEKIIKEGGVAIIPTDTIKDLGSRLIITKTCWPIRSAGL